MGLLYTSVKTVFRILEVMFLMGDSLQSTKKYPVELDLLWHNICVWEEFDVFQASALTNQRPLSLVAMAILRRFGLIGKLNLPLDELQSFLHEIEQAYNDVPYHNSTHAADVVQSLACMVELDYQYLFNKLSSIQVFSLLLAAIIHDVGHLGKSNSFLVQTRSHLALVYNDQNVNENMHLSLGFFILNKSRNNFLSHLSDIDFMMIRQSVIKCVLRTDMSQHTELMSRVSSVVWRNSEYEKEDVVGTLMEFALHCADLSSIAKPSRFAGEWSKRIAQENLLQEQKEKELGLGGFVKTQFNLAQSQVKFLMSMKPCFQLWQKIAPISGRHMVENINSNIIQWQKIVASGDPVKTIGSEYLIKIDVKEEVESQN
eukprot:TRINITY_DN2377_c0_g1_i1.p1 TRINITY_DN2377_c0_g1~~TRINITY_DN2377_c0_g1_i1.p1  ORF type:complete len:372 (+),score=22.73 TRINITY_DN2377_c0_g1_i1:3-1118(+)